MASLPVLSGREVVRVFQRLGWNVARQSQLLFRGGLLPAMTPLSLGSISDRDGRAVARP
jgi:hypothetical protein